MNEPSEMPTPLTDAKFKQIAKLPTYRWPIESKDFAKQLERDLSTLRKAAEAARVALANCIGELEEREWEYHGTFGDSWHSCPSCSVMQGSPHESDCGIDRRIKEATAALASLRSELESKSEPSEAQ